MLLHVVHHSVNVLEETHVTKLVQLIVSDRLDAHLLADVLQVCRGRRDRRHAGTWEAYLGGGAEFKYHIRVALFFTFHQDLDQVILLVVIQMVDAVCVIPVNTEILRRRLQACKTAHRLVRVGDTLRVGIFRHAPDALYRFVVVDIFLDHIHIRSVLRHRDIDHLNAKIFRDSKMTVVSWHRAEEFYLIQLAPRRASHYSVCHGACNGVKHDVQTGVSIDDNLIGGNLRHICKKLLRLRDTIQNAVISAVYACFTF